MNKLDKAINLRTNNKFEEAENIFFEILNQDSNNALALYHFAWTFDNQGKEKKAIPLYKKALKLNLDKEFRADCYLGLGSSYRMIGKYKKSIKFFDKAISEFPNNKELKVFRTLSLFELKEEKKAYLELLEVLLIVNKDKNITALSEALKFFIHNKK